MKNKTTDLNSTLTNLEESIADYSKQKEFYQDRDSYLEEYAHEVENMAKDGETWYGVAKK